MHLSGQHSSDVRFPSLFIPISLVRPYNGLMMPSSRDVSLGSERPSSSFIWSQHTPNYVIV